MYVHVLYNKIHLLKNLRMKQPVQVNPGLNCSFSYENCIYIYIYIYIYIQRITMCPHGYHHNGFMATPALGTQEVRLHIVWIAL